MFVGSNPGWCQIYFTHSSGPNQDDEDVVGGLVDSILAFYSNNPTSNPAGYLNFLYEKTKINTKWPGLARL